VKRDVNVEILNCAINANGIVDNYFWQHKQTKIVVLISGLFKLKCLEIETNPSGKHECVQIKIKVEEKSLQSNAVESRNLTKVSSHAQILSIAVGALL
jgi:hypothetical protein